jgi:hypothetical protein
MIDLEIRYAPVQPPVEAIVLTMTPYEADVLTDILARVAGNDGKDVAYRIYDKLDDAKLGSSYGEKPYVVTGSMNITVTKRS